MSANQPAVSSLLSPHQIASTSSTTAQTVSGAQIFVGQQPPIQLRPYPPQPSQNPQLSSSATSTVAPTSNPPIQQHHQSIFRFRSERANWLAAIGIVITLAFGFVGYIGYKYAADSQKLAVWEAEKDFQIYCQGVQAAGKSLSADCARVVDATLSPPPFYDPEIFLRVAAKVRRFVASRQSASVVVLGRQISFATWFVTIIVLFVTIGYSIFRGDEAVSHRDDTEQTVADKMSDFEFLSYMLGLFLPFLFRCIAILFWILNEEGVYELNIQKQSVLATIWVIGHLWAFRATWKWYTTSQHSSSFSQRFHIALSIHSYWRAMNAFLMSYDQSLGTIVMTGLDLCGSAVFMQNDCHKFREKAGDHWDDECYSIGPMWSKYAWFLGCCLTTLYGALYYCHLSLGGALLWMTGQPIIFSAGIVEPYLQLGRKLLGSYMLLFFVSYLVDFVVHRQRHRLHGHISLA